MESSPDYTRCSLHELVDVAQRIDRQRFPERHATVVAEIEKRRANSDIAQPSAQTSVRGLIWLVLIEYGIIGLLGIVGPIAAYNWPGAPATDMPMELLLVPLTLIFFALSAGGFVLMRWGLRSVADREIVMQQSLKAVIWAPWALLLSVPAASVARVALGFILPFSVPPELGILSGLLVIAVPFVLLFWGAKRHC